MLFGLGKLLMGGVGPMGVTTGLILLTLPYLNSELRTETPDIKIVDPEEEIEKLEPPEPEEPKKEEKEDSEGEDQQTQEDGESSGEQVPVSPNTSQNVDKSVEKPNNSQDTNDNETNQNENDDQENENNEEDDGGDTNENGENSPSLPGNESSTGKTKKIMLKLKDGIDLQKLLKIIMSKINTIRASTQKSIEK